MRELLSDIKDGFMILFALLFPISAWIGIIVGTSCFLYYSCGLSRYDWSLFIPIVITWLTIPILVPVCCKVADSIESRL